MEAEIVSPGSDRKSEVKTAGTSYFTTRYPRMARYWNLHIIYHRLFGVCDCWYLYATHQCNWRDNHIP